MLAVRLTLKYDGGDGNQTSLARPTNPAAKGRRAAATTARATTSTPSKGSAPKATRPTATVSAKRVASQAARPTATVSAKRPASKATRSSASAPAKRKSAAPTHDLRTLYPPIKPNKTGFLRVSDLHEIYYEESGNPDGKPPCLFTAAPGGGTDGKMRSPSSTRSATGSSV